MRNPKLDPWRRFGLIAAVVFIPAAHGASMKSPDVKFNPTPRMRYEITVSVTGAPGAFDRITGSVDYRVTNDKCVPMTPVTGATVVPVKHLPIEFVHAGENVYKAVVFADLLKDEDYFGLGLCHWSMVGAGADFVAGSVEFSPSIYKDDIFSGKQVTRFFAREAYAEKAPDVRVDIGENSREAFKNPSDTFSITVKAEEKMP